MDAFKKSLEQAKLLFDSYFLPQISTYFQSFPSSRVSEAAMYSLGAGGKRIRPIIAINSYYANKNFDSIFLKTQDQLNILLISAALECLHTYSLIHDDLPSMDNDDLRRGLPTNHIKFDEVTAILAGDALNSFGFYLLSELNVSSKELKDCFQILHDGVGLPGMITGQMEDLIEEGKSVPSNTNLGIDPMKRLYSIHSKKTGALIIASFLLGNRLRPDHADRKNDLKIYGEQIGLLFQITDDILDVEGDSNTIGKTPGKDQNSGKLTFPTLFGLDEAKRLRDITKDHALAIASKLDTKTDSFFMGFPTYLAERKN